MKYGVEARNLTKDKKQRKIFDTFEEARNYIESLTTSIAVLGSTDKFDIYYFVSES